jgi:GntR family transcriptional regulator
LRHCRAKALSRRSTARATSFAVPVEAAFLAFPGDRVDAVFTTHHVIDERQTQG